MQQISGIPCTIKTKRLLKFFLSQDFYENLHSVLLYLFIAIRPFLCLNVKNLQKSNPSDITLQMSNGAKSDKNHLSASREILLVARYDYDHHKLDLS